MSNLNCIHYGKRKTVDVSTSSGEFLGFWCEECLEYLPMKIRNNNFCWWEDRGYKGKYY